MSPHDAIKKGVGLVHPTFADVLALVRRQAWQSHHFSISTPHGDIRKTPLSEFQPWLDALCYTP